MAADPSHRFVDAILAAAREVTSLVKDAIWTMPVEGWSRMLDPRGVSNVELGPTTDMRPCAGSGRLVDCSFDDESVSRRTSALES